MDGGAEEEPGRESKAEQCEGQAMKVRTYRFSLAAGALRTR